MAPLDTWNRFNRFHSQGCIFMSINYDDYYYWCCCWCFALYGTLIDLDWPWWQGVSTRIVMAPDYHAVLCICNRCLICIHGNIREYLYNASIKFGHVCQWFQSFNFRVKDGLAPIFQTWKRRITLNNQFFYSFFFRYFLFFYV